MDEKKTRKIDIEPWNPKEENSFNLNDATGLQRKCYKEISEAIDEGYYVDVEDIPRRR